MGGTQNGEQCCFPLLSAMLGLQMFEIQQNQTSTNPTEFSGSEWEVPRMEPQQADDGKRTCSPASPCGTSLPPEPKSASPLGEGWGRLCPTKSQDG